MSYTTFKQIIEDGKRVAYRELQDGYKEDYRLFGKNLYCLSYNRDGHFMDMWCMGYAKKAARNYGIDISV